MNPAQTATAPRGILTVAALRSRCEIDPASRCWLWKGATSGGRPRIHTFDHARGEKRTMSGAKAAWNISRGEAPPAWAPLVFRGCMVALCLCPVHLRCARDQAEIGAHIRLLGSRKGTALDARRANILKAHVANGIVPTDAATVRAIRAAGPQSTNIALAALFGVAHQTVSRIRRGVSRRMAV